MLVFKTLRQTLIMAALTTLMEAWPDGVGSHANLTMNSCGGKRGHLSRACLGFYSHSVDDTSPV